MSKMRCKQCGANEDRINGFCSVEWEEYYRLEEEIGERDNVILERVAEIGRLNARIAELEAENIRLGIEYQRMRLALGNIAINSKRALKESPTDVYGKESER